MEQVLCPSPRYSAQMSEDRKVLAMTWGNIQVRFSRGKHDWPLYMDKSPAFPRQVLDRRQLEIPEPTYQNMKKVALEIFKSNPAPEPEPGPEIPRRPSVTRQRKPQFRAEQRAFSF